MARCYATQTLAMLTTPEPSVSTHLATFLVVTLHLHALSQVHQTFIDLPSLCQSGSGCLRIPGTLRTCMAISLDQRDAESGLTSQVHDSQRTRAPRSLS